MVILNRTVHSEMALNADGPRKNAQFDCDPDDFHPDESLPEDLHLGAPHPGVSLPENLHPGNPYPSDPSQDADDRIALKSVHQNGADRHELHCVHHRASSRVSTPDGYDYRVRNGRFLPIDADHHRPVKACRPEEVAHRGVGDHLGSNGHYEVCLRDDGRSEDSWRHS